MTPDAAPPLDEALARVLDDEPEPGDAPALVAAMTARPEVAAEVCRLLVVDHLLTQAHEPDPVAFADAVEVRLNAEEDDEFADTVLGSLPDAKPTHPKTATNSTPASPRDRWRSRAGLALAASVLLGVLGVTLSRWFTPTPGPSIAWLVNAQDCTWARGDEPSGGLEAGRTLDLKAGLAEVAFPSGASVLLQGPATVRLDGPKQIHLSAGRLTIRAPETARGFEVGTVAGTVVDLGTEFGVDAAADKSTRVYVFRGSVEAQASGASLTLKARDGARIAGGTVTADAGIRPEDFVRSITPVAAVPRTLALGFASEVPGTLLDISGKGTGFTHRLPGTGSEIPARDPSLRLDPAARSLLLKSTGSDLNGAKNLGRGEYLGIRLSDLGFTGPEDFEATVVIPQTPVHGENDQFGLYAGSKADSHIRGGLLRPGGNRGFGPSAQFMVKNHGGKDDALHMVGLVPSGTDLALTLRRLSGRYSLAVENRSTGESSTLAIGHPEFLDPEPDLYVGLFAASPWQNQAVPVTVKEFKVTVWTVK